jgi:hypothetical protein
MGMSFNTHNTMPVEIKDPRQTGGYHTTPTINDVSSVTTYEEVTPRRGVLCTKSSDSAMTPFDNIINDISSLTTYEEAAPGLGVLCTKQSDSAMTPFDNEGSKENAQVSANSSPICEDPATLDMASGAGMGMEENPLKTYIKPTDYETDSESKVEKDKVRRRAETE